MVYMFNELSVSRVSSREIVCEILENFVKTQIQAKVIGLNEIRLHEKSVPNLYNIPLCDGYNVDTWLQDNRIDNDLRDKFREIVTSSPLIKETEMEQNDFYSRSEFYKNLSGSIYQVWGLGAAFIYDTLSISLASHEEWNNDEVCISHYYLDDNAEERNQEVAVKHFSSVNALNNHIEWYENYQLECLQNSKEVWEKRSEFFPHIELCEEVERQLKKIGISKTLFQIVDRLRTLDDYVSTWDEGDFNYDDVNQTTNLRISPESDTTLQKFGSLRKFTIPKQGKELFDLHIKTGDLRFHFYPDNETKKVYIGYIGKHLRIASED